MTYNQEGEPQWVSLLSMSGAPPADSGNPDPKGGPGDPGGGPPGHDSGSVILTSLTTLNPSSFTFTFRQISGGTYTDKAEPYGIAITATAVPEPSVSVLLIGGSALAFSLFRKREVNRRRTLSAPPLNSARPSQWYGDVWRTTQDLPIITCEHGS